MRCFESLSSGWQARMRKSSSIEILRCSASPAHKTRLALFSEGPRRFFEVFAAVGTRCDRIERRFFPRNLAGGDCVQLRFRSGDGKRGTGRHGRAESHCSVDDIAVNERIQEACAMRLTGTNHITSIEPATGVLYADQSTEPLQLYGRINKTELRDRNTDARSRVANTKVAAHCKTAAAADTHAVNGRDDRE